MRSIMKRLLMFIIVVMLSAPAATAQDVSLHTFAGRTAPVAQDAWAPRITASAEALVHTDSNSNHTPPVRGGLPIGL
jgi:hypothetical protein